MRAYQGVLTAICVCCASVSWAGDEAAEEASATAEETPAPAQGTTEEAGEDAAPRENDDETESTAAEPSGKTPKKIRVLWTGASFVPRELSDMTDAMVNGGASGITMESIYAARGGTSLEDHIKKHGLLDVIKESEFDYIVINEISLARNTPSKRSADKARKYAGQVVDAAKAKGAVPIFYCSWQRDSTMPEWYPQMVQHYRDLHETHGGLFAPVGLAWQMAWEEKTEDTLHLYAGDMNHAGKRGVYLAACVMYATLTGTTPEGDTTFEDIPEDGRRFKGQTLDKEMAKFLQAVAWKTYQENHRGTPKTRDE